MFGASDTASHVYCWATTLQLTSWYRTSEARCQALSKRGIECKISFFLTFCRYLPQLLTIDIAVSKKTSSHLSTMTALQGADIVPTSNCFTPIKKQVASDSNSSLSAPEAPEPRNEKRYQQCSPRSDDEWVLASPPFSPRSITNKKLCIPLLQKESCDQTEDISNIFQSIRPRPKKQRRFGEYSNEFSSTGFIPVTPACVDGRDTQRRRHISVLSLQSTFLPIIS